MTWPTKKLVEVCEIVKGKKPILYRTSQKDFLPYLTAEVIRFDKTPKYASIHDKNSVIVNKDEIIIICDGSKSGDVFQGFQGILASTMGKIKHRKDIHRKYLFLFLKSNFEKLNKNKRGGAIPHLDYQTFNDLEIPLPPLSEQKKIVTSLDALREKIEKLKKLQEAQLEDLEELKKSILDKAFSGELVK